MAEVQRLKNDLAKALETEDYGTATKLKGQIAAASEVQQLKDDLAKALETEDYGTAAKLKEQIAARSAASAAVSPPSAMAEVQQLKEELAKALETEDYGTAAKLKEQIAAISAASISVTPPAQPPAPAIVAASGYATAQAQPVAQPVAQARAIPVAQAQPAAQPVAQARAIPVAQAPPAVGSRTDREAQLIYEYNSTEQQLIPLQNSEGAMQQVDQQVAGLKGEVDRRIGLLNKTQADHELLEKRIHRNENPRFLHYFVCNRDAKVERLKGEDKEVLEISGDLTTKIQAGSTQLSQLKEQQQNAHGVVDRKHQLESHCRNVFDQVVDARPATPALSQYQANVQQHQALMAQEVHLVQSIDQCVQLVNKGLQHFQQAEGHYRSASRDNQAAMQVVRQENMAERREVRDERRGDEFGAENAEFRRENLERQERRLQQERDNFINRAHADAVHAYQAISTAFASFPMEARQRYPQLCNQIGQASFPRVEGANFGSALMADMFGGTRGAAFNDSQSSCKIERNMHVVIQCVQITNQQKSLINAMEGAVKTNIQQLQGNISGLEKNIAQERGNIFNGVRSAVMSS